MLDGALSFRDDWTLCHDQLWPTAATPEALFTASNGYVGVRAGPREPLGDGAMTLIAGCFESRPYAYPERSFGFPDDYQTIVPVTDATPVLVDVDGVAVRPETGTWLDHRRELDLRTGCVTTSGTWRSPDGETVAVRSRRLASLDEPGLVWLAVEVEPLDHAAAVEIISELRGPVYDRTFPDEPPALSRAWGRVWRPVTTVDDGSGVAGLVHTTALSGRSVACVVLPESPPDDRHVEPDRARLVHRIDAAPGRPAAVVRRVAYAGGAPDDGRPDSVAATAVETVQRWASCSFDEAVGRQREVLDRFWEVAAVEVGGDADVERAIRFSAFQLLQATACNLERASPAKGLTGQGYEGHQLWDQEIYIGHALSVLAPDAARRALRFRCRTLPEARARARELGHDGAEFPWRTIDGHEASALFPAGAAQHHLNADIAFAVGHYVSCTGDEDFLAEHGVEILVETARHWLSIGHTGRDGRFRIESVTGPDEYTAVVDNNLFTNVMAAANLQAAADRLAELEADDPKTAARLRERLDVGAGEPGAWREAAGSVFIPYDDELRVHAQDQSFLQKPRWDLAATPPDRFPLQDHHHLLTLYRHQVLKQPDVVLAMFLQAHRFTREERRRNYDYYEPLTSHDSSLSAPIHAVVAADVGRLDQAWAFTRTAAFMDLDDRHGTLGDGIHLAAAAGSWIALVCGFGGFGMHQGEPRFRPQLPPGVDRLRFRLLVRGRLVEVDVATDETTYRLLRGEPLTLHHGDDAVKLGGDEPAVLASFSPGDEG